MATITLTADTDYSALTLANDDTIDCAGFILTLDEQPTQTGIQVTSPGTNGRVVFSGAWILPTWDFFAGASTTAGMIGTLPVGAEIGIARGGTVANARCISINEGLVTVAEGGSALGAHAINTNDSTVTTANGLAANAAGVNLNRNLVVTANAGSVTGASGVSTNGVTGTITTANGSTTGGVACVAVNNGYIATSNGGTVNQAHGCNLNNGTISTSNGGSIAGARGINTNNGICLRLLDGLAGAVNVWNGTTCFVDGPFVNGVIPSNIKTIYSLGALSASATIAGDANVIEVSKGKGLTGIR